MDQACWSLVPLSESDPRVSWGLQDFSGSIHCTWNRPVLISSRVQGSGVSGGHWEPAAVCFIQHKQIWRPSGKFWVLPECLTCASLPTAVICIINHQENTEPISSPPFELDAKSMSYQKSSAGASLGSMFDRPAGAAVQRRVWSIHASDFTSTLTACHVCCVVTESLLWLKGINHQKSSVWAPPSQNGLWNRLERWLWDVWSSVLHRNLQL